MDTKRNTVLEVWMAEHGYSSNSLANAVNKALEQLTGRTGGFDGSAELSGFDSHRMFVQFSLRLSTEAADESVL